MPSYTMACQIYIVVFDGEDIITTPAHYVYTTLLTEVHVSWIV